MNLFWPNQIDSRPQILIQFGKLNVLSTRAVCTHFEQRNLAQNRRFLVCNAEPKDFCSRKHKIVNFERNTLIQTANKLYFMKLGREWGLFTKFYIANVKTDRYQESIFVLFSTVKF